MNDIDNVISRLEKQRSAIDRALLALREISGPNTRNAQPVSQSRSRKRLCCGLDESNSCARVRRNSRLTSCLASRRTLILRRPSVTPKIFFARSTRRRKFTLKMRSKISRSALAKNYAPHIGDSSSYSGKPKRALLQAGSSGLGVSASGTRFLRQLAPQ